MVMEGFGDWLTRGARDGALLSHDCSLCSAVSVSVSVVSRQIDDPPPLLRPFSFFITNNKFPRTIKGPNKVCLSNPPNQRISIKFIRIGQLLGTSCR